MPTDVVAAQTVSLFFFAHQDDEFGVFQKILDERREGRRVLCAYLTDGAVNGKPAARRDRESLVVLRQLGVKEEDVLFMGPALGISDGCLPANLTRSMAWMHQWAGQFAHLAAIYLPAWEGGHHDHDALHAAGVLIARQLQLLHVVRQFSLYNGFKCRGPFFRVLQPLPQNGPAHCVTIARLNRFRFLRYCLSYPSQKATWLGLFPFVSLHYLFSGTQALQPVSLERLACRPHDGPLYYEKRGFYTWQQMKSRLDCLLTSEAGPTSQDGPP